MRGAIVSSRSSKLLASTTAVPARKASWTSSLPAASGRQAAAAAKCSHNSAKTASDCGASENTSATIARQRPTSRALLVANAGTAAASTIS